MLALASPFTFGDGEHRGPSNGWHVDEGKLVIETQVASRNGDFGSISQAEYDEFDVLVKPAGELVIQGNGSFTAGGGSQGLSGTITLRDNAQFNLYGDGIFEIDDGGDVDGRIIIQDNAVFTVNRDATALGYPPTGNWSPGGFMMTMEWGKASATIDQDGGTVNFDVPLEDGGYGPGLIMSGRQNGANTFDVDTTYNLNGGTLNVSGVFNTATANPPSGPIDDGGNGYSPIFNFNGGTLKASQSDSTDAGVIADGFDHLMGNLWHAYVKDGGAIVDTNTFNASIDQALEHDPLLGGADDGGLTKLGEGTLTLLQHSDYTGDTSVEAGVLEVMHAYLSDTSTVSIGSGAKMNLNFGGTDNIEYLTLGGAEQASGIYNAGTDPGYFIGGGSLTVTIGSAIYVWAGTSGSWADDSWDDGEGLPLVVPASGVNMTIDVADAVVTVNADFQSGGTGPAASVEIGNNAELVVAATKTLEVTRAVNVGPDATLTVNGILSAGATNVEGTLAGNGTISTSDAIEVTGTGTLAPSGVLTLAAGEMSLDGSFDARVNGEVGQTAGGQIKVSDGVSGAILELGGTLKITATGRTTFSNFEAEAVRRVVDVTATGAIGAEGGGMSFAAIEPAISEHVGQGSFLQGVEYATPGVGFENIIGVDVELFIAKGGDTDGDGKVWLEDWLNFRPNFDSTGSPGLDWTDGDFDGDGRVWLSDWLIFRPGFSGTPYYTFPTEGEAVPEPCTLAMLLAGLIGLAIAVRRSRA